MRDSRWIDRQRSKTWGTLGLLGCMVLAGAAYAAPRTDRATTSTGGAESSSIGRLSGPVGLVISRSAETLLGSLDDVEKGLKSQIIVNRGAVTERDPSYLVDRLTAALKRRYPDIRLAPSVAASSKAGNRSTIVVDVTAALGQVSGQSTTVEISLAAYDAMRKARARVTGRGSAVIPYPAFNYGFQPATDQAIAEIESKL